MSESGFESLGQHYNWVAKWGSVPPSGQWLFWQWQGAPLDRNYFNGTMDDLRAFIGLTTGDSMIQSPALTSPKRVRIVKSVDLLDEPGGSRVTTAAVGVTMPYIGLPGGHAGWYAVLFTTPVPYADKIARPSILYMLPAFGLIEDTPPPVVAGDTKAAANAALDKAAAAVLALKG
jgi:hypothetical protein